MEKMDRQAQEAREEAQVITWTQQDFRQQSSDCRPVQASFGVRNTKEKLPVFVADIEGPYLLRMYYLTQCEASLDLGRQTMRVQNEEMPLFLSVDAEMSCVESRRVTAPGAREKLQSPWERPIISEALTDVTYRITPGCGGRRKVVHVDHLASYPGPWSLLLGGVA
ncbi:hypothetical protein E2C01_044622 [Portunus trituberculatus]|uniref:Integrase p58-like C-terminal domain-containing protein n=1 Tax=Portunus trituberculatus TaxID=210409 RepID=A0A5B7G0X1_PORTR|nr:hypothetical protein [Portunus trituberculatus]